jgi:hypothetical protein
MKHETATSRKPEKKDDALDETDVLGEQHASSMAVSSNPPLNYDSPYLSSCAAVTSANLYALRPLMSRPAGTAFLGANASTVMCHIGTIESPPRPVLIDTRSDISLISYSVCMSLKPKPKIKTGQKIQLLQVTGLSTITGFVQLTLYFDTAEGPVSMPIEAYVVKGMNSDFILGNDFGDQYQLSITRDDLGSKLILGESKRWISLANAVISPNEQPVRATRSQRVANYATGKIRTIKNEPKPKVRAVSDTVRVATVSRPPRG